MCISCRFWQLGRHNTQRGNPLGSTPPNTLITLRTLITDFSTSACTTFLSVRGAARRDDVGSPNGRPQRPQHRPIIVRPIALEFIAAGRHALGCAYKLHRKKRCSPSLSRTRHCCSFAVFCTVRWSPFHSQRWWSLAFRGELATKLISRRTLVATQPMIAPGHS